MAPNPLRASSGSGAFWFALSVLGSLAGVRLSVRTLPGLRGEWVAVALLLSWRVGYLVTARRYRWQS